MMTGCPFVAGPACRDCDGSCWEPEPKPDLCETCSKITGGLTTCDGWCIGVTTEQDFNAACARWARFYGEESPC